MAPNRPTPTLWQATVLAELKFDIPKMYKHHTKKSVDVQVDFWRIHNPE